MYSMTPYVTDIFGSCFIYVEIQKLAFFTIFFIQLMTNEEEEKKITRD